MILNFILYFLLFKNLIVKSISSSDYRELKDGICKCEVRFVGGRITGSQKIFQSEFHWVVAIYDSETRRPHCTGSLINNNTVLTAAHCFDTVLSFETLVVLAGNVNSIDEMLKFNYSRRYIKKVHIHPSFRIKRESPPGRYDVAIVILEGEFELGSKHNIYPACIYDKELLPKSVTSFFFAGFGITNPYEEDTITGKLVGFKTTNSLNYIELFTNKELCQKNNVSENFFCLTNPTGSPCNADSGGPLYINIHKKIIQVGIFQMYFTRKIENYVFKHCEPNTANIFNKVKDVFCWIQTLGKPLCVVKEI